jgi:hypothetical protein
MRETHRIRDDFGKGFNWFSATDSKRKSRCYLHGMRPEEVSLPIAKMEHSLLGFRQSEESSTEKTLQQQISQIE